MLLLGSSFAKIPILSLRTGAKVGNVVGHLINPHSLTVDALWIKKLSGKTPHLLLPSFIRETSPKYIVINDEDALEDPDELVRLHKIIDMKYELLGKKVVSGKLAIGKVIDYAVDSEHYTIQKLYASPSIWNTFKNSRLTIDRSQIVAVSHKKVIVEDTRIRSGQKATSQPEIAPLPMSSSASTISE